ncbi:MAG: DUF411 domain-containing protein [Gemmatimonadota bacterium]|jgi:hypothetical protein
MRTLLMVALVALVPIACNDAPEDRPAPDASATVAASPVRGGPEAGPSEAAEFVVYKSPTCGCCNSWIEHLRDHGHDVEPVDVVAYDALAARKGQAGVPNDLGSCHTAVVDGYTIEGHVPADVIERLLRERPDIRGLAVPGMPIGSPGMEGPDPERYDVIAFDDDGDRYVYATIDPRAESSSP